MLASIDIGSNTVRLLIAEQTDHGLEPVRYDRRITRLAGDLCAQYGLHPDSMQRTLTALTEFRELCRSYDVTACQAVATAAFRHACNGQIFANQISAQTSIPVAIISGEEEARLTASGVLLALTDSPENSLIFDIGGGSTEFIHLRNGQMQWVDSLPLGVVRLSESRPSEPSTLDTIKDQLSSLPDDLLRHAGAITLVGTAGTVTSLAAMLMEMTCYDWRRINNAVLQRSSLADLHAKLKPMSPSQREALPGLEKGRGDLILPGLQIVLVLLERFRSERLIVSDFGLLEGVALQLTEGCSLTDFPSALN